jgi:hypothetical protein
MKSLMKSVVWPVSKNLSKRINGLNLRLKIRQINEACRKQGKIAASRKLPAGLSTETVDAFLLAVGHIALQPAKESRCA